MGNTLRTKDTKYIDIEGVTGQAIIEWGERIYYSKFAKDQPFDIAYFSPIFIILKIIFSAYCVLKLSICHVQLALIIFNSLKSIFIFEYTKVKHCRKSVP